MLTLSGQLQGTNPFSPPQDPAPPSLLLLCQHSRSLWVRARDASWIGRQVLRAEILHRRAVCPRLTSFHAPSFSASFSGTPPHTFYTHPFFPSKPGVGTMTLIFKILVNLFFKGKTGPCYNHAGGFKRRKTRACHDAFSFFPPKQETLPEHKRH